jgi:hypothetical protein
MNMYLFKLKNIIIFTVLFLVFMGLSSRALAATYYWVGTSGGNVNSPTNWSTSSGGACSGGGNGATLVAADVLYFTSSCTNNATISTSLSVTSLTISSGYTGTITQSVGSTITLNGAFSQADGIFMGGVDTISAKTFSLTGGIFNSTSGTLSLSNGNSGSFVRSGSGVFNHMNGTVYFAGGHTMLTADATTFYRLTTVIPSGNYLYITGTITVNNLLLNTSGVILNGNINALGNVTFGSANATYNGTGLISAVGTSSQSIVFTGGGGYIPKLVINNSQATITYNGTTTFSTLTLSSFSGEFDIGNYPVTFSLSGGFTMSSGVFRQGAGIITAVSMTFTGGTFNGGTGAINISSSLAISSGVFTSTSGTLTVSGNGTSLLHTGGSFNHNNGTVRFSGFNQVCRCDSTILNDLTIEASTVSSAVVFYKSSGSVAGTTTVSGDFNFIKGSISSGVVSVTGENAVLYSGASNTNFTGTIRFDGVGSQTVTIAGGGTSYYPKLVINNPDANIAYNGVSTINSLSISNGTFALNGNNITVSSGLTVGSNGNFKRYGSETITTSVPSFSAGATVTYNGTAASYTLPNYTYTNAHVIIDTPSSDTIYNMFGNATTTNLTIASGVLNQGTSTLVVTDSIVIEPSGSWINSSTGPVTIGSGGVSNSGYISFSSDSQINIRSTVSGSQRPWVGSGLYSMTGVNVKDQGGTSPITVYGGTNNGNNDVNWTFSGLSSPPDRIWRGSVSSTWSSSNNWVEGSVPTSTSNAIFTSTYKNPAVFDVGAVNPAGIVINSGYSSTITLAKDISLSSFYQNAGTFNADASSFTTTGTFSLTGGTFKAGSDSATFDSGVTVSGGTFMGETANVEVNGNLTVSDGIFMTSSATTSLSGNLNTTGGTFTATSGVMFLDGTNQTITGTTTFNNLVKTVTSAANLIFGAGQTFTILGTTTLSGQPGQLLTLKSTSTPAQWLFDPQGGLSLSYLSVKDSNNISSSTTGLYEEIDANSFVDVSDGGNNTNWTFVLPTITVSATGTQATSTGLPTNSRYMGGVFQFVGNVGTSTVSSITLTQSGSLPTNYISSVSLYYKSSVAGVCEVTGSFPTGTTLFGTDASWTGYNLTFNGSMPVGINPVCVYTLFNLAGTFSTSNMFMGVDLHILNPSEDVIATGANVQPETDIDIPGATLVVGGGTGYPTITLSAQSSSVSTDSIGTTLTWTTGYNPNTCTASGDNGTGGEWVNGSSKNIDGGSALTGVLASHRTYTFILTCANTLGTTTASVSVVAINPNAPILTLTASPSTVNSGSVSALTWTLGGGPINVPTSCMASGGWSGEKNVAGGGPVDTPTLTQSTTFSLACGNSYGTTTRSVGVSVVGEPPVVDSCVDGFYVIANTPCTSGGGTLGGAIGDSFSLAMADEDINPTVFYFYNDGQSNALYIRQGPDGPNQINRKLTADDIHITEGSFGCVNRLSESNQCAGVKVFIKLKKISNSGSTPTYSFEKTFKTTATTRSNAD